MLLLLRGWEQHALPPVLARADGSRTITPSCSFAVSLELVTTSLCVVAVSTVFVYAR